MASMSSFPLVINFEGDYGMKVLLVDPDATMDDIARIAKDNLVGVVLKPLPPNTILRVRRHGDHQPLAGSLKVRDAGFVKMETVDIYRS